MYSKFFGVTKYIFQVRVPVTMGSTKIEFWSMSSKESLEIQQKHENRNRFLQTLLCSNDIFNSGYNQKLLIRDKKSIPDKNCFIYEQLFHQYNAPLVKYVHVVQ